MEKRWGSKDEYVPTYISENDMKMKLVRDNGMYCELLSVKHLPDQRVVKLYIDRDVKRAHTKFSKDECDEDLKVCLTALNVAFPGCEWAICSRHGFNPDKGVYCISFHFVAQSVFVKYDQIPYLLQKHKLDSLFDMLVYKPHEQLWQMPLCHKTAKDKRVLLPITFKDNLSAHFIQVDNKKCKPETVCTDTGLFHTSVCSNKKPVRNVNTSTHTKQPVDENDKNVQKLNKLLEYYAGDKDSKCYRKSDNSYYYKTCKQNGRMCWVNEGEFHVSNNFVLSIFEPTGGAYYKCMSKECIRTKGKLLGYT